jgi:uncharacterized protein
VLGKQANVSQSRTGRLNRNLNNSIHRAIACNEDRAFTPRDCTNMPPSVTNNTAENRFESTVDNETAVLTYEISGNRIALTHTRVPKAIEHRGIGTNLVETAIAYARAHHLKIDPQCAFAAKYFAEHPEHQPLLA